LIRSVGAFSVLLLAIFAVNQRGDKFSKYKAVEAYEVRPGILMMPQYAADGEVCEIGLERRRYSPKMIQLDGDIQGKDLNDIVDELAPDAERGLKDVIERTEEDGGGMTTFRDYQNVSVVIYSHVLNNERRNIEVEPNIAVTIAWKNHKCE
jgi:hypothetical protein